MSRLRSIIEAILTILGVLFLIASPLPTIPKRFLLQKKEIAFFLIFSYRARMFERSPSLISLGGPLTGSQILDGLGSCQFGIIEKALVLLVIWSKFAPMTVFLLLKDSSRVSLSIVSSLTLLEEKLLEFGRL